MENKWLTGSAPVDVNWHPILCILCVPRWLRQAPVDVCAYSTTQCAASAVTYAPRFSRLLPVAHTTVQWQSVASVHADLFIYLSICLCRHTNIQELRNMTCCELRLNLDLIILIVSTAMLEIQAIAAFKSHFCVCGGRRLFLVYVL